MEKNNKTLVLAVLIMLLALVSFNFNKGSLSGRSVNLDVYALVSPSYQVCEKYGGSKEYTLELHPGSHSLRNDASIVESDTGYKVSQLSLSTNSFIDRGLTKDFLISCDKDGTYRLKFYDTNGQAVGESNPFSIGK